MYVCVSRDVRVRGLEPVCAGLIIDVLVVGCKVLLAKLVDDVDNLLDLQFQPVNPVGARVLLRVWIANLVRGPLALACALPLCSALTARLRQ